MQTDFKSSRSIVGSHGEQFVAAWLENQGFTILQRNYRKKCGEVDLIALRKNILIFVEVKTRLHEYFNLSTVITPAKQRKITLTAKTFLAENSYENTIYRFDLALLQKQQDSYELTYIPNAFTPPEEYNHANGNSY